MLVATADATVVLLVAGVVQLYVPDASRSTDQRVVVKLVLQAKRLLDAVLQVVVLHQTERFFDFGRFRLLRVRRRRQRRRGSRRLLLLLLQLLQLLLMELLELQRFAGPLVHRTLVSGSVQRVVHCRLLLLHVRVVLLLQLMEVFRF